MASFEEVKALYRSPDMVILEHRCRPAWAPGPVEPVVVWGHTVGFVRHGLGVIRLAGRTVQADMNQCLLLNPLEAYEVSHYECRGEGCALSVQVTQALAEELFWGRGPGRFERAGAHRFPISVIPREPAAGVKLQELLATIGCHGSDPSKVDEAARSLLRDVGRRLSRTGYAGDSRRGRRNPSVERVKRRLAESFREKPSLEALAREVGCSKYHLCRQFRREEGVTIGTYVHRLRVEEALARLARGEDDLTVLAFDLGFSSHSHFTAVFRRIAGRTPSELRRHLVDRPPTAPRACGGEAGSLAGG